MKEGRGEIRNYLRDQTGSRSLVLDLSIAHDSCGSSSHPLQHGRLTRTTSTRLCILYCCPPQDH